MDAFISRTHELACMFTQPNWRNPAKEGKYLEGGLKPIEAFCDDVMQNLVAWACEGDCVYYRTQDYWYMFCRVREGELAGVVWMTRYENGTYRRMDDWANPHSVHSVGAPLLKQHLDKRVPLFDQGSK